MNDHTWQPLSLPALVSVIAVLPFCSQTALAQLNNNRVDAFNSYIIAELDEAGRMVSALVDREVRDPVASDISMCDLLPMGKMPCGQPTRYVAYSRGVTDVTRLESLGELYSKIQNTRNAVSLMGGGCMEFPSPHVELVDGRCRAVSGDKSVNNPTGIEH